MLRTNVKQIVLFIMTATMVVVVTRPLRAAPQAYMESHIGDPQDASVIWDSTYRFVGYGQHRLEFERPLPAGSRLLVQGAEFEHDASGRAVALRVDESLSQLALWELRMDIPGPAVRPPFSGQAPAVVQVVDGSFDASAFASSPLELRLGYVRHVEMTDNTVERLEEWAVLEDGETPIYVIPDDRFWESGGIDAVLVTRQWQSIRRWIILVGLALAALLASLVGFVVLRRQARHEAVEAYFQEHETIP